MFHLFIRFHKENQLNPHYNQNIYQKNKLLRLLTPNEKLGRQKYFFQFPILDSYIRILYLLYFQSGSL